MTRISAPTIRTTKAGFTLIEIMVVIGLIALVSSVAIPNFGMALKINISNSTRELATTIRATHDEAVLKGDIYRMVFDLKKGEYWVEQGDRNFLMRTEAQEEEEAKKLEKLSPEEREKRKDPFTLARAVTKKKQTLPKGVMFTEILTARSKDPITDGMAYVHFFPHGFVEKLVIHLKDDFDREATLFINPVTGKSKLFERNVKEYE